MAPCHTADENECAGDGAHTISLYLPGAKQG